MHVTGLFVFSVLLAVCIDIPPTYGASVARDLERDPVEILKRQGSVGVYGNAQNGRWDAGVTAGYSWNNGRSNLGGHVGYQPGRGTDVGISYTYRFGK